MLVIEGDGDGRREVGQLLDALIWVQSDEREAGRRSLVRAVHADAIDSANRPTWHQFRPQGLRVLRRESRAEIGRLVLLKAGRA